MASYELLSKTIKPVYKAFPKRLLDAETAKKHPDYPNSAYWNKQPSHSHRLHVKINQSIDQIYIVSVIDEDYEEATTRDIIVKQENLAVSTGDLIHMDPDTPSTFIRFQEAGFSNKLAHIVFKTKELHPKYGKFIEDVVKYLRSLCRGTKADQHLFITLEFKIEEIYGCNEDVADNW